MSVMCLCLDRHNIIGTWAFLTFSNFIFNCLTIIKCFIPVVTSNFRVMNEKILASIFGRDETKAFACIKPLHGTFTHFNFSRLLVNYPEFSTYKFTVLQ